jgi:DNA modification methylase
MDYQTRPLSSLHTWEKNPRSIDKKDFQRLKDQITQLGIYKPLLITEDGTVLGGNMRLRAYQELGIIDVPVSVVEADTEQKRLEYALSDNERAGNYDEEKLAELVLATPEINLELFHVDLGKSISLQDISSQFGPDPEEDEVPEVSTEPAISKRGEVYRLGRHYLMCGDSTKREDVEKLMDGKKADMVFTDPPYGVNYEEKTKSIANQRKDVLPVANDNLGKDALKDIVFPAFQNIAISLKNGGVYYVCSPQGGELGLMMMMMMNAGIECRHMIIWKKNAPVFSMGRLDYDYQHEPILYGWRGSHHHYGNGKFQSSVWEVDRPSSSKLHPTMKPVALVVNAIQNSTKEEDIVLDLFGGSGTTLIASEETGRTCYMMELDEKYCDVIRKRYENFIAK